MFHVTATDFNSVAIHVSIMLRRKPSFEKAKYAFVPPSCKLQVINDKHGAN